MKTKLIILLWLLLLTIFILRIHGQMNERPTNGELLDVKDRVSVLELDFQHNQDRVWKEVKAWLQNKRIVPVGNGMFLAVEKDGTD